MSQEIDLKYEILKSTFYSGSLNSIDFRKQKLKNLLNVINIKEKEIYSALKYDLNKSELESLISEIGMVKDEIRTTLKHLNAWSKPQKVFPSFAQLPSSLKIIREPYGIVLIMSPWNYPFQLTLTPIISAIASGNTVMVKPSEYSPKTSELISKICSDAFGDEYVSVVQGGYETNQEVLSKKFDYIFFTGSPKVGKVVMEKAALNLTPLTLELGGKSPAIVDITANIEKTAKRIVFGKFMNSGQTCVAPDYVYVESSKKEMLVDAILKYTKLAIPNREYMKEFFPKIITEKHFEELINLISDEKLTLPKNSWIGENLNDVIFKENLQIYPIILSEVNWQSKVMNREIFGPILPILSYDNEKQLFEELKYRDKPLVMYIFSNDKNFTDSCIENLSSGGVLINDTLLHLSSTKVPFGGVGNSGMGNYHGKWGFNTFSHERTVMKKSWSFDISLRHHPYSQNHFEKIKKFIK